MMQALPALVVVWAIFTGLFLALLAYNSTVSRYEDSQLFLADIKPNQQQQQSAIVRHVNRLMPYVRALGGLSAVMTVLIIGIYTWDAWQRLQAPQ